MENTFISNGDGINITINYPAYGDGTNKGWLDYIQLNARRKLTMTADPLTFRDTRTLAHATSTFRVDNADQNVEVWDISNRQHPKQQDIVLNGNILEFGTPTADLKEFVAFRRSNEFPSPQAVGSIANQNIHATDNIDLAIIYHKNFESQVVQLAEHRRQHSNLRVATIPIDLLYNEFSCGAQDPTAIRDFARMLYVRDENFRYLLLFGDASFDYKNIYGAGGNFVPTFETLESTNALSGFPTDDHFTFLDEEEGDNLNEGKRDIAVGRIPARDAAEAQGIVNKIIHYDSNPICMGDCAQPPRFRSR